MTNGFPAEKVTFRSQGYGKQVLKGREEGEKAGDLDDFQGVKFCTKAFKVFVPMPWKLQLTLALLLFYGIRTKDNSQRRSELPWEKCPSPRDWLALCLGQIQERQLLCRACNRTFCSSPC